MQLDIHTLILLTQRKHYIHTHSNTHRPQSSKKRHVQLLGRRQITQLGDTLFKSSHKPLCSLSIWEACVFVSPLCEGYFGYLATVLLLQQWRPIKSLLSFIHCTFLPSGESNLVLQKVLQSLSNGQQWKPAEH